MERQELNYQDMEKIIEQNSEMTEFLNQFPVEMGKRDLDSTLAALEENLLAIRTQIENKPKRITLLQIDQKLDLILNILSQNCIEKNE